MVSARRSASRSAKDGFKVVANCLPNFEQKDAWLSAQRDLGFNFAAAEGDVSNYESCAAMVAKIEAESARSTCW